MAFLLYCAFALVLFLAFALLALTQFTHRRSTGTAELPPERVRQARFVAGLLLCAVLCAAIYTEGGGFGVLLWAGLVSLAACAVTVVLGWRPALLAPLARLMLFSTGVFSPTHQPPGAGG
ncbi:DUF3325 family protein [Acetobacter lambici]|uniref:DUF3325 domain-containing protein n=1 Tax=Acetobacter lambici TaxID=1332824 RepID=A0ABT1F437_9PROT|nr:DUF3325 domain-containing protein [Acetobacter lambici]MCP1243878.1 DUF3325 domain-containing protein [Acetobacter lambici]MCP1259967.1 DUF3325 domain-containing protein [Acetobacter lambici]NHO58094.1 DUF3325 family protein [Acetobacter lambici]